MHPLATTSCAMGLQLACKHCATAPAMCPLMCNTPGSSLLARRSRPPHLWWAPPQRGGNDALIALLLKEAGLRLGG